MNRKEWKEFCSLDKGKAHYWYNKVRKFLKSKEFESDERTDKDAKIIHHLRDTEEQRKYNDEHYEMFGFEIDKNGNEIFNYGKYVVFWTKEHHSEYHSCSEETRKKRSESLKGKRHTEETKKRLSEIHLGEKNHMYGKRGELCPNYGKRGELSHRYGTHLSEETRKKISDAQKGENTGIMVGIYLMSKRRK